MIRNKKRLIILIVLLIIGVVLLISLLIIRQASNNQKADLTTTEGVNYNPPTKEEIDQATNNKENNDNPKPNPPQDGTKQQVKPIITVTSAWGDFVEVAGVVQEIFEKDGTCTFSFTNGETVSKGIAAVAEGRSTYCPTIQIPKSEFKRGGVWNVTMVYSSSYSSGRSEIKQLEINL